MLRVGAMPLHLMVGRPLPCHVRRHSAAAGALAPLGRPTHLLGPNLAQDPKEESFQHPVAGIPPSFEGKSTEQNRDQK